MCEKLDYSPAFVTFRIATFALGLAFAVTPRAVARTTPAGTFALATTTIARAVRRPVSAALRVGRWPFAVLAPALPSSLRGIFTFTLTLSLPLGGGLTFSLALAHA